MSQNIPDENQTPAEQPTGATLLEKMTEAIGALNEVQEHLVDVAKDVAKHTTDPNAHGAATLANITKAMPKPVLEDGMFSFKDADGNDIISPVNIKGDTGKKGDTGDDGAKGDKGDMPDHQWNGTSLQIQKPDGSWGEEQDLQGPKGEDGTNGADGAPGQPPEHAWNGPSLKFKNPDGTWGEEQNLKGEKGDLPDHEWEGTSLKLQKPDGSWGEAQDLQGPKGEDGDVAVATAEQPGIVMPDGMTTQVNQDGLLSALGGNLLLNSEEWITTSGEWEAPVTAWYELLLFGGGESGAVNVTSHNLVGGASGKMKSALVYLTAGQKVPVVVGAGGPSPELNASKNVGGETSFGDITTADAVCAFSYNRSIQSGAAGLSIIFMSAIGLCAGRGVPFLATLSQAEKNAACSAFGHFGGGGGATLYMNDSSYSAGAGAPGSVRARGHDPAKAGGPLPAPALLSARRKAPRALGAPATVNLYDPDTGQGSVWREEDAEAKLAEGLISEEAWREILAQKAGEEYAEWLTSPDTEAERFELLRATRKARLAEYDAVVAELRRDERAGEDVTATLTAWDAYANALCALPQQSGAPWDGGGEATPWPEAPEVSKVHVQPEEPEQTEEPEV